MIPTTTFEKSRANAIKQELSHLNLNAKHPKLQQLAKVLKTLFGGSSTCAISYLDYEDAYFLGIAGPDADKYAHCCRRDCFICSWTFLPVVPETLIVQDARKDHRFKSLPLVISEQVVSYIGSPIITPSGLIMGTVCIVDNKPRKYSSITASFLGNCADFISQVVSYKIHNTGWALRDCTGKILFNDGVSDDCSYIISASICIPKIKVPFVDGDDNLPDLDNLLIQRSKESGHKASTNSTIIKSHGVTELGAILGKGSFGTVQECNWQGREAALKQIECIKGTLSNEGLIGCRLHHQNLLQYYSAFIDKNREYLIMEICRGGSMQQIIDVGSMDTGCKREFYQSVKLIASQLAKGLQKIHKINMVHCDIKPGNILLSNEIVKISDFGLLHVVNSPNAEPGTVTHMPPEAIDINKKNIGSYTDIYSFGVFLWEMLTLQRAWAGYTPWRITMKLLTTGGNWMLPADVPELFHIIVTKCTDISPELRPNIDWIIDKLQSFHQ